MGVWLSDQQGKILYGNPAGQRIWGGAEYVGPEEFKVYQAWWADTHQPLRPEDWAIARAVRNRETSLNEVLEIECFDGSRKTILNSAVPILDEGQALQGVVVVNEDITERVSALEALRQSNAQLARSNRDLQDFAFIASHDLQEPLRKIQAFGGRLKDRAADHLDAEALDYLERMRSSAARMSTLLQDLLAYSQVSTRFQPPSMVNLTETAAGVLSDLELTIERSGGRVELSSLPSIFADPAQMRQLFQNLIGNALKFHQPGVPPRVRVYASGTGQPAGDDQDEGRASPGHTVQICIEDNGIGFDASYAGRIFQPFQRLVGRSQ